ncbi:hypothetical protein B5M09_007448 [Aphanomyces astaci]|uniref:Uncharacterized protein n=1 Tax=Aphanomyces astaci TaxID=112090 RepID=A0A3R7WH47_APHAT|nr:hypothetical protein B5M09_007448 [Aphanomyces astaci]
MTFDVEVSNNFARRFAHSKMSSAAMTATIVAPSVVKDALRDAIASFPEELQASLMEKFTAYYTNPETPHVEQVLRKRMSDGHAQRLLFMPTKEQAALYVLLVQAPPQGAPETHPCFIGGLNSLVDLFTHENLHFRGQALDVFTQMTSNPDFDWFQAPTCSETKSMHAKMLLLTNTSDFIQALVINKDSPAMSLYALQILAFYMSWVRKLYTKGELRLSAALLATLADWKATADSDEERQLATNVFDDFNRWPAADAPSTPPLAFHGVELPEGTLNLKQARDALVVSDYDQTVALATTFLRDSPDVPSVDRVQALGLRGRARLLRHLDRADLKKAVDDLSAALEMLEQVAMPTHEDNLLLSRVDMMQDKATVLAQHLHLFRPALAALSPDEDACLSAADEATLDTARGAIHTMWAAYNALHGQQQAKEQAIFEAIRHRRGAVTEDKKVTTIQPVKSTDHDNQVTHNLASAETNGSPPSAIPRTNAEDTSNQATNHDPQHRDLLVVTHPTPPLPDSSVAVKTKNSAAIAGGTRTLKPSLIAPVARKLLKYKHNPENMASLLQSLTPHDIAAAVSTILNPDVLRGLLQGMRRLPPKHALEVMRAVHILPAMPLVLELADPDVVTAMSSMLSVDP